MDQFKPKTAQPINRFLRHLLPAPKSSTLVPREEIAELASLYKNGQLTAFETFNELEAYKQDQAVSNTIRHINSDKTAKSQFITSLNVLLRSPPTAKYICALSMLLFASSSDDTAGRITGSTPCMRQLPPLPRQKNKLKPLHLDCGEDRDSQVRPSFVFNKAFLRF
ncbi:hypothetical protein Ciccas_005799 [Cichlidogyrus casuarinus]|uniref:Uncharacterized protein n=1 Tax=Cichlidogyrus casuarinus TaxID=1844966 RepID=A0ABD2QA13_9PLAT